MNPKTGLYYICPYWKGTFWPMLRCLLTDINLKCRCIYYTLIRKSPRWCVFTSYTFLPSLPIKWFRGHPCMTSWEDYSHGQPYTSNWGQEKLWKSHKYSIKIQKRSFSTKIQSIHLPLIKTLIFCAGGTLSYFQNGRKKMTASFLNVTISNT